MFRTIRPHRLAVSASLTRTFATAPPKKNRWPVALLLAAAAMGSTVFASTYQKADPIPSIEPKKIEATEPKKIEAKEPKANADSTAGPAFANGEVSVIFVLGGPGAGKGTQCANLVRDYGFVHLSAGDLLRAEQTREGSKYGELIAQCIRDGLIVPQVVTVALLEQAIKENHAKGSTRFLVDGFPRKMDQAITFEEQIAKSSFTLFFECPEAVMMDRLLERGKSSGRADDNLESIKKRFRTFVETSMPVIEYFEKQDRVVKVGCDQPVEEVYGAVKLALSGRGITKE